VEAPAAPPCWRRLFRENRASRSRDDDHAMKDKQEYNDAIYTAGTNKHRITQPLDRSPSSFFHCFADQRNNEIGISLQQRSDTEAKCPTICFDSCCH
jgi:hypothetical protein